MCVRAYSLLCVTFDGLLHSQDGLVLCIVLFLQRLDLIALIRGRCDCHLRNERTGFMWHAGVCACVRVVRACVCVCVCARCVRGKGGSERAGESHPLLPDLAFIQHALDGLGNLCVCVRTRERHEHCVLRLCLYMRRHTILLALCFCSFWSSQKFEACACEERSSTGSHTSPLSLVRDRFDAMERPSAFCSSRSRRGGTA